MSYKAKYIGLTALCTSAAICAFLLAYRISNAPSKIFSGDEGRSADLPEETQVKRDGRETPAAEPDAAEALATPERIVENTNIIYEYYYEGENKTERIEQKAPEALLNLTREQLIAKIEGFGVISFSPTEVVLRKKIPKERVNKYILGIWDGRVAVFYSGSGVTQSGLKEVTDTPVSSLSPGERERLNEGIVIEGDGELMKVLEDYGS